MWNHSIYVVSENSFVTKVFWVSFSNIQIFNCFVFFIENKDAWIFYIYFYKGSKWERLLQLWRTICQIRKLWTDWYCLWSITFNKWVFHDLDFAAVWFPGSDGIHLWKVSVDILQNKKLAEWVKLPECLPAEYSSRLCLWR